MAELNSDPFLWEENQPLKMLHGVSPRILWWHGKASAVGLPFFVTGHHACGEFREPDHPRIIFDDYVAVERAVSRDVRVAVHLRSASHLDIAANPGLPPNDRLFLYAGGARHVRRFVHQGCPKNPGIVDDGSVPANFGVVKHACVATNLRRSKGSRAPKNLCGSEEVTLLVDLGVI